MIFFTLAIYMEVLSLYVIIAKVIFEVVLTYTPLIRVWFVPQNHIYEKIYMWI